MWKKSFLLEIRGRSAKPFFHYSGEVLGSFEAYRVAYFGNRRVNFGFEELACFNKACFGDVLVGCQASVGFNFVMHSTLGSVHFACEVENGKVGVSEVLVDDLFELTEPLLVITGDFRHVFERFILIFSLELLLGC